LIKLEYQLKEKKTGSVRGSDKVSSWLNGNEFDKQHGIVQERVEQQHKNFEDRSCTSIKNWLKPHHNNTTHRMTRYPSF
jgi:hypothetical protein